jgi:hypothetical protein
MPCTEKLCGLQLAAKEDAVSQVWDEEVGPLINAAIRHRCREGTLQGTIAFWSSQGSNVLVDSDVSSQPLPLRVSYRSSHTA